ncbi:heterokaryon incompatibility protein-domain-containing protein [Alternaria rosae]|uniref:heterokaryon incompatibility protein-domain-containing protein n=1 Tax=Alternaria rosae TaxID=1187941 RepID=UPI001E8E1609|nr:heterokaryon incompatibility protein-domain-containing protein [Alternaria rosae]KAH6875995.1 heterokaryon incompatibility protein-domain-containing protein [Alternaria rosae]
MAALGYTQLDRSKKTIRLLTVAPGDPQEQIRCELTHADLDEHPSFIALSYTWDQGGGLAEIQCCGEAVQVGKNLRNFLRRFRVWDEGRGNRLWIDALCINQCDVHERNHQVGQMHILFSTATSAIAWLGEASCNSDLAYSAVSAPRNSLGFVDDKTRQALVDLLSRPYWSRVWVIQEFLLPVDLTVWWSGCRATAHDLRLVVWDMARLSSGSKPRYPRIWDTPGKTLLRYRVNYQRMRGSDKGGSSAAFWESMRLRSLLQSFSASQCTLIQDGVYALLGIASDVTDSPDPISPDYTKPHIELLLDVVRNQCGAELPETRDAWCLIDSLCNILRCNRQEIEKAAFVRARKVKREMYALDLRNHSFVSFNWCSYVSLLNLSQHHPKLYLMKIVVLMAGEKGCLTALQDYLDYTKSHCGIAQGSIKDLLGQHIATFGKADHRPWTDVSRPTMVPFNHQRERPYSADLPSESSLVKPIIEQLFDEGWSAFFEPNMVGLMRRAIGRSEHTGVGPCKRHNRKIASYHEFGRYGSAIVLECQNQRAPGGASCRSSNWYAVGTAFIRQQE